MNKAAAYHEWLGIPFKNELPNHYEILGVPLFESNPTVISNGAARRISFLQTMVVGAFAELAQEIQKEVAQAKLCLMRESSRLQYQQELMDRVNACNPENKEKLLESTFSISLEFTEDSIDDLLGEVQKQSEQLARQKIWLIGSSKDCDLVIKNHYVSRKHCLLFKYDDKYELEDWGSTNGTFVNEKMLPPHLRTKITKSDVVTLGKCTLMPWPPVTD